MFILKREIERFQNKDTATDFSSFTHTQTKKQLHDYNKTRQNTIKQLINFINPSLRSFFKKRQGRTMMNLTFNKKNQ